MSYRILTTDPHRWGEGWQYGDIVEMDDRSAAIPLARGEIEKAEQEGIMQETAKTDTSGLPITNDQAPNKVFICPHCQKECKTNLALSSHQRIHKE